MYVLCVETRTKILNTALPSGKKNTHKSDQTSKVLAMTPRYHFTPGFWLSIVERCWTSMIVTAFSVPLTDALSHWKPYHLHQWFQKQQNLIDWSFDILTVITFQLMMWYLNLEPSITFVNTTSLHHLSASYSYVVTKGIMHMQEASENENSRTTRSLDTARSDYMIHSAVPLQETLNAVKCC